MDISYKFDITPTPDQVMILLLSVPTAMTYYPKVGFTKEDRAFAIFRTE